MFEEIYVEAQTQYEADLKATNMPGYAYHVDYVACEPCEQHDCEGSFKYVEEVQA